MIRITERQEKILSIIAATDGIRYGEILERAELTHGTLTGTLYEMMRKGVIARTGTRQSYKYHKAKGVSIVINGSNVEPRISEPDRMLDELMTFRLTAEQLQYIKDNKHMSRTELARKLGIGKLELNMGLEKGGAKR